MTITRENVLHLAKLSRLRLSDDELDSFQSDLARIVQYVEKLGNLDTTEIPPTAHVAVSQAPLRIDQVVSGLSNEAALNEAPRPRDGGFAVPAFVDEG
jgi:aspartyl-tRNA(Asn)/glutamyl-tRNA(Gln) amidotransferase subunit C